MTARALAGLWRRLGIPPDYPSRWRMPMQTDARRLVAIGRAADDGRMVRLAPGAARAWARMRSAAAGEGVQLLALSGHRSIARQAAIFRRKLAQGEKLATILRYVAAPGCSEHHTGRAVDLGSPGSEWLDVRFGQTREYRWLRRHASRFGFSLSYPKRAKTGIGYEPWHWCWRAR